MRLLCVMKNRFDDVLRENNQLIIELSPCNVVLRVLLAMELEKVLRKKPDAKIIELGCGEGDSTLPFFRFNPGLHMDVLDVSPEMIEQAKKVLKNQHATFICEDALDYLRNVGKKYDVITVSWVIHNFSWEEKRPFLKAIYDGLADGAHFLMMDKVYPGTPGGNKEMFEHQQKRYDYLIPEVRDEIKAHEVQDFDGKYRMDEPDFSAFLREIGFKDIKVIDRVERDLVLIARK